MTTDPTIVILAVIGLVALLVATVAFAWWSGYGAGHKEGVSDAMQQVNLIVENLPAPAPPPLPDLSKIGGIMKIAVGPMESGPPKIRDQEDYRAAKEALENLERREPPPDSDDWKKMEMIRDLIQEWEAEH